MAFARVTINGWRQEPSTAYSMARVTINGWRQVRGQAQAPSIVPLLMGQACL